MNNFVVALIFSFFLISCGGGSESKSQPTPVSANIQLLTSAVIAGDLIQLSASNSKGEGVLSYQWQLDARPNGSQASLLNTNGKELEFAADLSGSYQINLTVTDNNSSSSISQEISVAVNKEPVINTELSSSFGSVVVGDTLRLDAHLSSDPEQRALSYKWEFLSQPEASTLVSSTGDYFDFLPILRGNYSMQLSISDGYNTVTQLFEYKAVESRVLLIPDVNSDVSALEQVETVFGAGSTDLPETHDTDHLTIESDNQIGDHFTFTLHLEEDGDRDTPLDQTDRQRSEIKSYANSANSLTCEKGESMSLIWQFKAEDIGLSYSFSHLFQIKGANDHPLLTFTARRISSESNAFRILHGEKDTMLAEVDWEQIKERWLNATLHFSCENKGYLTVQISDVETQNQLVSVDISEIDMWQDIDLDKLGFKFGFYRRVKIHADDESFREGLDSLEDKVRVGSIRIETH